jgi:hypothetical protein
MTLKVSNINFTSTTNTQIFANTTSNSIVIKANNTSYSVNSLGIYTGSVTVNTTNTYRSGSPVSSTSEAATGDVIFSPTQPAGTIAANSTYNISSYSGLMSALSGIPDNLTNWTTTLSATPNFVDIAYGNNTYVAVGPGSLSGKFTANIYTSSDATTWTARTSAGSNSIYSVVYGNGVFLASSIASSPRTPAVQRSTDNGATWTHITTFAQSPTAMSMAYANATFCLYMANSAGGAGSCSLYYSKDHGATWTQDSATFGSITGTIYGTIINANNIFVATSNNMVRSSSNGSHWSNSYTNNSISMGGIAYDNDNNVYLLSTSNGMMKSSNLTHWTQTSTLPGRIFVYQNIQYCNNGIFVAVAKQSYPYIHVYSSKSNKEFTVSSAEFSTWSLEYTLKYLNSRLFYSHGPIKYSNVYAYNASTQFKINSLLSLSGYNAYVKT